MAEPNEHHHGLELEDILRTMHNEEDEQVHAVVALLVPAKVVLQFIVE